MQYILLVGIVLWISTETEVCRAATSCPAGYTLYSNLCYSSKKAVFSLQAAVAVCSKDKATLVSIHDQSTNTLIAHLGIRKQLIGLQYKLGEYRWLDGSKLNYNNWALHYPMPQKYFGDCVAIAHDGKWRNVQCASANLQFICQKPSVKMTTTAITSTSTTTKPVQYVCPDPHQYYFDKGTISSPGYPKHYVGQLSCQYQLVVKNKQLVEINFEQIQLSVGDYIAVYDYLTTFRLMTVIRSDSNGKTKTIATKNSNEMMVVFKSIRTSNGIWAANWRAVEAQVLASSTSVSTTASTKVGRQTTAMITTTTKISPVECPLANAFKNSGTIESPGYPGQYGGGLHCNYMIIAKSNKYNVAITYEEIELSNGDNILLFNGNQDQPFASFDASFKQANITFVSQSSIVRLLFRSSKTGHGKWRAIWNSEISIPTVPPTIPSSPDQCPAEKYSNGGVISSPGYPNGYGVSLDCFYYLTVPEGDRITLDFEHIETQFCCDLILVFDGPTATTPISAVYSGTVPSGKGYFFSTSNKVTVRFVTSNIHSNGLAGWVAKFQRISVFDGDGCSLGWYRNPAVSNQRYCLHQEAKWFEGAKTQCEKDEAQMLSIESVEEDRFATELMRRGEDTHRMFWIGLKYINGQWTWTNGSLPVYTKWANGEPNLMHGRCAAIEPWTGVWRAMECDTTLWYICSTESEMRE